MPEQFAFLPCGLDGYTTYMKAGCTQAWTGTAALSYGSGVPVLSRGLAAGLKIAAPRRSAARRAVLALTNGRGLRQSSGIVWRSGLVSGGYAYAMGYQDASGQLHGLRIDNVLNDNDSHPGDGGSAPVQSNPGRFRDYAE